MDLFEYQAKELFAKNDVPVTDGTVVTTADQARAAAAGFGAAVVVKAQVKTGGRGKAGGVKLADDADDAQVKASAILGMDIKGHTVHRVLITPATDIAEEYYVAVLLDRANRSYLVMASVEGGVEIEEVARTKPEALVRVNIDALRGLELDQAQQIVGTGEVPRRGRRGRRAGAGGSVGNAAERGRDAWSRSTRSSSRRTDGCWPSTAR